jgi:peroxiredoxin
MAQLKEGDPAPLFTGKNQNGNEISPDAMREA